MYFSKKYWKNTEVPYLTDKYKPYISQIWKAIGSKFMAEMKYKSGL
jgi:hypothetical protein